MITVKIARFDHHIVRFEITGHARFKKRGEDIVCAGVSAISQTAIFGLTDILGLKIELKIEDDSKKPLLFCELPVMNDSLRARADDLLETMLLGIQNIVQQYQEFVRIEELEV